MADQFVCCECGAKKESKDALKSHISIKHLQWLPYECPHCYRCTREATKQDLLLHINQTHPGQQLKYTCLTDPEKKQLLKHKMHATVHKCEAVTHENSSTSSLPFSVTPVKRVKSDVITIDDDEDSKPPILTAINTSAQLSVNSEIANSAPKRNAKWELVDDDDDDFEPFAPSDNSHDSQCQQPVLDSETGHSSQQTTPGATNHLSETAIIQDHDIKSKTDDFEVSSASKPYSGPGYCLTCKRLYSNVHRHLEPKLSAPVYECSKCIYRSKSEANMRGHIRAWSHRGAKMVRIRSQGDVAREMQQLRQIHFGMVPEQAQPNSSTTKPNTRHKFKR